jgi:hypothetical protein
VAVAAAQQIAIVRGLIAMVAIAAFGPCWVRSSGGDHADVVRWLAPLPMLRSLTNLRIKQVLQEYRNAPEMLASIAAKREDCWSSFRRFPCS